MLLKCFNDTAVAVNLVGVQFSFSISKFNLIQENFTALFVISCVCGLGTRQMSTLVLPTVSKALSCRLNYTLGILQTSGNSLYGNQNASSKDINLVERMPQIKTVMEYAVTEQ